MNKMELLKLQEGFPALEEIRQGKEMFWINPKETSFPAQGTPLLDLTMKDIEDAEDRLERFAPFIEKSFPETKRHHGLIESDLVEIPAMKSLLSAEYGCLTEGTLMLKMDAYLPIAGSVKARGGIYEVLKHAEELALEHQVLQIGDSYSLLTEKKARQFFSEYMVQVGSTGNLGMSIGIMSAALGFQVVVHMSADAKQWKKDLLRAHGVVVKEYSSDYSEAVKQGRKMSDGNPNSYFVDDENSKDLFLGYAVAAKRLWAQLLEKKIAVDAEHPLFVYIPCGVGGAPGGITFGLKQLFGDFVHCFFVEPTQAPCMLVGMGTGLHQDISVQDIGLTGQTEADGLAVGRASGFIGRVMEPLLGGIATIEDRKLYEYMKNLLDTEGIFVEPSSCAAFHGPVQLETVGKSYMQSHGLCDKAKQAVHIIWSTGGSLVPNEIREEYLREK